MSVAKPLAALLGLLLAVPAAGAYVQPVFYFLKDAPSAMDDVEGAVPPAPVPIPLPVGVPTLDVNPGVLDPYDRNLGNAPNSTTSKTRYVTPGTDALFPVQFVTPGNHTHPDRIRGPIFVGLWTGESTVLHGNLTLTLFEVPADGSAAIPLANASVVLDLNQSELPTDPTVFIPQNQTDPQAILFYEVAMLYPMLLHPPALFILGPIDVPFSPDSGLALGLRLDQGSSPVPMPAGATASVQYDGAFTPSFVYMPWYAPDPPRPTFSYSPRPIPTRPGGGTFGGTDSFGEDPSDPGGDGDSKDSPGLGLVVMLGALLAVAALASRRRLR